jgi:hypothetical protein
VQEGLKEVLGLTQCLALHCTEVLQFLDEIRELFLKGKRGQWDLQLAQRSRTHECVSIFLAALQTRDSRCKPGHKNDEIDRQYPFMVKRQSDDVAMYDRHWYYGTNKLRFPSSNGLTVGGNATQTLIRIGLHTVL